MNISEEILAKGDGKGILQFWNNTAIIKSSYQTLGKRANKIKQNHCFSHIVLKKQNTSDKTRKQNTK